MICTITRWQGATIKATRRPSAYTSIWIPWVSLCGCSSSPRAWDCVCLCADVCLHFCVENYETVRVHVTVRERMSDQYGCKSTIALLYFHQRIPVVAVSHTHKHTRTYTHKMHTQTNRKVHTFIFVHVRSFFCILVCIELHLPAWSCSAQ